MTTESGDEREKAELLLPRTQQSNTCRSLHLLRFAAKQCPQWGRREPFQPVLHLQAPHRTLRGLKETLHGTSP